MKTLNPKTFWRNRNGAAWLPGEKQIVAHLYATEGLSQQQIAEVLGRSMPAIRHVCYNERIFRGVNPLATA